MTFLAKTAAVAATGLFALTAPLAAETIAFGDLNTTIDDGESGMFDLNGDGLFDLLFSLDDGGNAMVQGLSEFGVTSESYTSVFTDGGTLVTKFGEGDTIGAQRVDKVLSMGGPRMVNDEHMGGFDGDLANWGGTGVTGFLGFTIETVEFAFCELDTVCEEDKPLVNTIFGYLELERGSIILGQYVLSSGPVTIPQMSAVPLPAGLPLMLAGLGAFGIARRRKARAA